MGVGRMMHFGCVLVPVYEDSSPRSGPALRRDRAAMNCSYWVDVVDGCRCSFVRIMRMDVWIWAGKELSGFNV
jgi:hypothetical protein